MANGFTPPTPPPAPLQVSEFLAGRFTWNDARKALLEESEREALGQTTEVEAQGECTRGRPQRGRHPVTKIMVIYWLAQLARAGQGPAQRSAEIRNSICVRRD